MASAAPVSYAKVVRKDEEDAPAPPQAPPETAPISNSVPQEIVDESHEEEDEDGFQPVASKTSAKKQGKDLEKAKSEKKKKRNRNKKKEQTEQLPGTIAVAAPASETPETTDDGKEEPVKYVEAPLPKVNPWKKPESPAPPAPTDNNDSPTLEQAMTKPHIKEEIKPEHKEKSLPPSGNKKAPWKTSPSMAEAVSGEVKVICILQTTLPGQSNCIFCFRLS